LAFLSLAGFMVMAFSVISFISLYVYEMPTHNSPFAVLKERKEQ
jgi:hypothetical protein